MKRIICFFFGHDKVYEQNNIDHLALYVETAYCNRCDLLLYVTDVSPQ